MSKLVRSVGGLIVRKKNGSGYKPGVSKENSSRLVGVLLTIAVHQGWVELPPDLSIGEASVAALVLGESVAQWIRRWREGEEHSE